jgi:PAP2 superfamily
VYDWSATDTIGHMANLYPYDPNFTPPAGNGFWEPCEDFPTPALLPQWGETRTFITPAQDHLAAPLPPFSMDSKSAFYVQALEVYTINSPLSSDNQWVAEFWSDDFPVLTFSSAGRWISICNQVIQQDRPTPEKALETYLRMGLALSDAVVACWYSKYHYNLLRPETFIRHTIQPGWRPIVHTPPFPAYPSGHAMLSAAAAEVLTSLYGKKYELTDRSHEGRTEFKGMPRHFHSFYEMAFENASSRIALGVHYRMDCEEGTRLGLGIGKIVAELPLTEPQI